MFLQSGLTPLASASKNHNDAVEFLVSKTNADLNTTDQVSEYYGQLHNIVIYVATGMFVGNCDLLYGYTGM